jgi:hypothetical protein
MSDRKQYGTAWDFELTSVEQTWFDAQGEWRIDWITLGYNRDKAGQVQARVIAKIEKFDGKNQRWFDRTGKWWTQDFPNLRVSDRRTVDRAEAAAKTKRVEKDIRSGTPIEELEIEVPLEDYLAIAD